MAAIPVRKPVPDISTRNTAFKTITFLQQEFIDINKILLNQPWDDAEKGQIEQLLRGILNDLQRSHRELLKYPAPAFVPSLKLIPIPKGKQSQAAITSADTAVEQFKTENLKVANDFKDALYKAKDRYTTTDFSTAERQYEDIEEEYKRLSNIASVTKSPLKFATLIAQSRMPQSNYIQVGSTKYYMKEDAGSSIHGIPLFKEYFFKPDPRKSPEDNQLKLEEVKAIFRKVFTSPTGVPLAICDRNDTTLLEEALLFYMDKLREELIQKQKESGPDMIPVRTLLVKVESTKNLIDVLLAKQTNICLKGAKAPEDTPMFGSIPPDELKRILRKLVLILAAKQKDVGGRYKQHSVAADELLKLLDSTRIPNVQNANLNQIETNFNDVLLKGPKLMKILYELGKGSVDEVVKNIENTYALQLLQNLAPQLADKPYITQGLDLTNLAIAGETLKTVQTRLINFFNQEIDEHNKLKADCQELIKVKADLTAKEQENKKLVGDIAGLQKQITDLQAANPNLAALQAQLTKLQGDYTTLDAFTQTLHNDISQRDNQIRALQAQIAQKDADIARLDAAVQACNADKQALDATIQGLRAQLATKDQEKDQAVAQAIAAKDQALAAKDQERAQAIAAKDQEIANLTTQINDLQTNLAAVTQTKDALELRLQQFQGLPADFREQYNALKQEKQTLTQQIQTLDAQLRQLTHTKDAEIKVLQDQLTKVTSDKDAEIKGLRDQLAKISSDKDAEIQGLRNQIAKAISDKDAEIKVIRDQLTKLTSDKDAQIKGLQDQLAKVSSDKDAEIKRLQDQIAAREISVQQEKKILLDQLAQITAAQKALQDENDKVLAEIRKRAPAAIGLLDGISKLDEVIRGLERRVQECEKYRADVQAYLQQISRASDRIRNARLPVDLDGADPATEKSGGPIRTILDRVRGLLEPRADVVALGLPFYCKDFATLDKTGIINKLREIIPEKTPQQRNEVADAIMKKCRIKPSEAPSSIPADTHFIPPSRQIVYNPAGRPNLGRGGTRKLKKKSEKKTRKNKDTTK